MIHEMSCAIEKHENTTFGNCPLNKTRFFPYSHLSQRFDWLLAHAGLEGLICPMHLGKRNSKNSRNKQKIQHRPQIVFKKIVCFSTPKHNALTWHRIKDFTPKCRRNGTPPWHSATVPAMPPLAWHPAPWLTPAMAPQAMAPSKSNQQWHP